MPGRRFSLLLVVVLLLVTTSRCGFGQDEEPPPSKEAPPAGIAPAWSVGDWWKVTCHPLVGTQPKRPHTEPDLRPDPEVTVTVTYRVVETREVAGNRCWVIEMTNDKFEQERVVFFVRALNLTLKQLEISSGGDTPRTIDHPSKTYIHEDTGTLVPLDLPRLPREARDETVADTVGTGSREFIQTTRFSEDGRRATVEIRTTLNGKPLVSTQVWEANKPWWSEARRTLDGQPLEAGRLVDWKGKE